MSKIESSRNPKYREASSSALIELLHFIDDLILNSDVLSRLWRIVSRVVDDVSEAVVAIGFKLFRSLGEVTLRILSANNVDSTPILNYLINDGITHRNASCSTLSIDCLLRLDNTLDALTLADILPLLILKLLECLSSLEMQGFQYAQFHVDKKQELEKLRVTLSQSGPIGQLLKLSVLKLKDLAQSENEKCVYIIGKLDKGLRHLLKFGVGLNTRLGCATFVATLAMELPFELKRSGASDNLLLHVFLPYIASKVLNEDSLYVDDSERYSGGSNAIKDFLVIESYCYNAASICNLADHKRVRNYVVNGVLAYTSSEIPSSISGESSVVLETTSRYLYISAIAMYDVIKKYPPNTVTTQPLCNDNRKEWYTSNVYPAAYIGQYSESEIVRTMWKSVMDELPPSIVTGATSMLVVLHNIERLLKNAAWGARKQAAIALDNVLQSNRAVQITNSQIENIYNQISALVSGRLWKGKGTILNAIVRLANIMFESNEHNYTIATDCQNLPIMLLSEAQRGWQKNDTAYSTAAIQALGTLSPNCTLINECVWKSSLMILLALRQMLTLWVGADNFPSDFYIFLTCSDSKFDLLKNNDATFSNTSNHLPPFFINTAFEALANIWPSDPCKNLNHQILIYGQNGVNYSIKEVTDNTIEWMGTSIHSPIFNVWSIWHAIFQAMFLIIEKSSLLYFGSLKAMQLESIMKICCGEFGMQDPKYSMVRVAACQCLVALTDKRLQFSENDEFRLQFVVQKDRILQSLNILKSSNEASELDVAHRLVKKMSYVGL